MPFEFFIEWLYPLPLKHKKMFGVDAYYIHDHIVFALCQHEKYQPDHGIWIATKQKYHQELTSLFTSIRPIKSLGIKTWLVLPEAHDAFEEDTATLVTLLKSQSKLVGNLPKKRKP